jgi:hypothetical protein
VHFKCATVSCIPNNSRSLKGSSSDVPILTATNPSIPFSNFFFSSLDGLAAGAFDPDGMAVEPPLWTLLVSKDFIFHSSF